MWYSAVNFGYKNKRISDNLKKQIDTLPQLASQYLHKEKVDLAEIICKYMEDKYGVKGRVHFNVGGAQAIEDSLKVVRNHTGKTHQFDFRFRVFSLCVFCTVYSPRGSAQIKNTANPGATTRCW